MSSGDLENTNSCAASARPRCVSNKVILRVQLQGFDLSMTADGESEAGGSEAESEVSVSSKRSEQRKFSLFRRVGKFGKAARAAIVEEAKNAVNDVKEFAVGVRDGAQLTVQDAADYREKLATQAGEGWFLRGVVAEEAVASDVDSTVVPGTAPQSQQIEEQPLPSALEQVEQGDKESAAQPNDDEPLVVKVSKVADGEASPGKGFGLSHLWQRTSRSARPSCASEPPVPEVSVSAVSAVAAFASVAANAASAAAAAASASADALRGDAGAASSSSSWMMNPSTVANYVVLFDVETPRRGRAARSAVSWKARRLGGRPVWGETDLRISGTTAPFQRLPRIERAQRAPVETLQTSSVRKRRRVVSCDVVCGPGTLSNYERYRQ